MVVVDLAGIRRKRTCPTLPFSCACKLEPMCCALRIYTQVPCAALFLGRPSMISGWQGGQQVVLSMCVAWCFLCTVPHAAFILTLFRRGEGGIEKRDQEV